MHASNTFSREFFVENLKGLPDFKAHDTPLPPRYDLAMRLILFTWVE